MLDGQKSHFLCFFLGKEPLKARLVEDSDKKSEAGLDFEKIP
jgi:hypothetical protein